MDTLINLVEDLKVFIYGGMQSLPLVLGGTLLLLGLFTANYGMLFFLAGYMVLTPLVTGVVNAIFNNIPDSTWFKIKASEVCGIYSNNKMYEKDAKEAVVFSQWLAMISFFVGYIANNAMDLYNKDTPDSTTNDNLFKNKVMNRKAHAIMSWIICGLVVICAIYLRNESGCEGEKNDMTKIFWRIPVSTIGFGTAGYYWYNYLTSDANSNRLSDLFGIANRLLPPVALTNKPTVCLPYKE
jgi:hypothetical protein